MLKIIKKNIIKNTYKFYFMINWICWSSTVLFDSTQNNSVKMTYQT